MKPRYLIAASFLTLAGPTHAADPVVGEEVLVTSSRLGQGIAGASTSVISAEEIKRSPAQTLPDLLSLEAGVQSRDLYGGVAGAQATLDIRGFGSSAKQNTLILVNGRKINDFDLSSVDWAAIPLDSIQRVEVIRGNAGSVLYGDGAVGGVVNIVTKAGGGTRPSGSIATSYGSYSTKKLEASAATGTIQGFSANAYGSYLNSDGYRDNNDIRERNFVSELRRGGAAGDWFVKLGADDQSLGLPGVQRLSPGFGGCPPITSSRRAADTPLDKATQNSANATIGHSRTLTEGVDVVLDASVRRKDQEAQFIDACFGGNSFNSTQMTTWSLTPRVVVTGAPLDLASTTRMGLDLYYVDYESERRRNRGERPSHIFSGYQTNAAAYALNELAVTNSTDLSLGARVENSRFTAGDNFDASAPGAFGPNSSLDQSDTNFGVNLGLEQKVLSGLALFGRAGRSFRTPNIDERVGATGISLFLKPQWSWDVEGGVRAQSGPYKLQSSVYRMAIRDEIHFIAATFTNVNLDPTRRLGWETTGEVKLDPAVRLKGSLTYINAKFTAGRFDGNDVPLVAPWTGNVAAFWDIMPNLHAAGIVNAVSAKRFDNDEANFQAKIGGYWTADFKVGGEYGAFNWSAQVNNIFDRQYFTYGVASAGTAGIANIYPLPERSYLVRAGVTF